MLFEWIKRSIIAHYIRVLTLIIIAEITATHYTYKYTLKSIFSMILKQEKLYILHSAITLPIYCAKQMLFDTQMSPEKH